MKMLRKDFIVVSVPFSEQNKICGGVYVFAHTPDRKELHRFHWGTDRRHSGLPFREAQHEENIEAVRAFLQECLKKSAAK